MDVTRAASVVAERARNGRLLVLTGAGISAECGIPTFRGKEGYWTRGSKVYHPMELATHRAFVEQPATVWGWYLYRRSVCRAASPGAGHRAVADMARLLGERFDLVTQNVDGLHARSGVPPERMYEIHGNIDAYRCARACTTRTYPVPERFDDWPKDRIPDAEDLAALACPACGGPGRPHVLWFDECYDEPRFRAESAMDAAARCDVLVVVGTSGATNLPMQIGALAVARKVPILDVNLEDGPFGDLARRSPGGGVLRAKAGEVLPGLSSAIAGAVGARRE